MNVYTNYKYSPAAEDKTSAAGGQLKASGKLQIQNSILNRNCKSRFHFNSTLSTGRDIQTVAVWTTGCRYYRREVVSVEKNRFSPPSAAGRGSVHIQP